MLEFENAFGTIEMICDEPGCSFSESFESNSDECDLYKAVKEAKENGWKIYKKDGDWVHVCPMCVERHRGE